MNDNNLYVIGNGFDLYHDLDTSPRNLRERTADFFERHGEFDSLDWDGGWADFEASLGTMDLAGIVEEQVEAPDYLSDHESDRGDLVYTLEGLLSDCRTALDEGLRGMAEEANEMAASMCWNRGPRSPLRAGDAVLNFNYTSTLEILYEVPDSCEVFNIHGRADDGDLVYGYGEPSEANVRLIDSYRGDDCDPIIFEQVQAINDFYKGLKKPDKTADLVEFLNEHGPFSSVVVLGYGMGAADARYLEAIGRALRP